MTKGKINELINSPINEVHRKFLYWLGVSGERYLYNTNIGWGEWWVRWTIKYSGEYFNIIDLIFPSWSLLGMDMSEGLRPRSGWNGDRPSSLGVVTIGGPPLGFSSNSIGATSTPRPAFSQSSSFGPHPGGSRAGFAPMTEPISPPGGEDMVPANIPMHLQDGTGQLHSTFTPLGNGEFSFGDCQGLCHFFFLYQITQRIMKRNE